MNKGLTSIAGRIPPMPSDSLCDALKSALTKSKQIPGTPKRLPLIHVTRARHLDDILSCGALTPRPCPVFGESFVFLFYGGAFFRYGKEHVKRITPRDAPVAFMLPPTAISALHCLYPFDTGGAHYGYYGMHWSAKMKEFARFMMNNHFDCTPERFVQYIYGTNANYLRGVLRNEVIADSDVLPPLRDLIDFYNADIADTMPGADRPDQRRMAIECQCAKPLVLNVHQIESMAFPSERGDIVDSVYAHTGRIPQLVEYTYHEWNPLPQLVAKLEEGFNRILQSRQYL